jgi:transposase-like protein
MRKLEEPDKAQELVAPSAFCWNPVCSDHGRIDAGNLRQFGTTRKGRQRYQCKICGGTFTKTRGTVFHGKHHDEETILDCLALLAERNSLAAIHRVKGVQEETVSTWLQQAATQVEAVEAVLLRDYRLSRAQLDALWTYVGHKGEKGGAKKGLLVARSGAGPRWRPTRVYGSGWPSPRPKEQWRRS